MSEYYAGCIGCVDFAQSTHVCDYGLNYEHCRPCAVYEGGGCMLYSSIPRKAETEEQRRTWSPRRVAALLSEGMTLNEIAETLGASRNSIVAWVAGTERGRGEPAKTGERIATPVCGLARNDGGAGGASPSPTQGQQRCAHLGERTVEGAGPYIEPTTFAAGKAVRKKRGVWDEEQYRKLHRQGLNDREAGEAMGLTALTIYRRRNGLGLPPNRGRNHKERT